MLLVSWDCRISACTSSRKKKETDRTSYQMRSGWHEHIQALTRSRQLLSERVTTRGPLAKIRDPFQGLQRVGVADRPAARPSWDNDSAPSRLSFGNAHARDPRRRANALTESPWDRRTTRLRASWKDRTGQAPEPRVRPRPGVRRANATVAPASP